MMFIFFKNRSSSSRDFRVIFLETPTWTMLYRVITIQLSTWCCTLFLIERLWEIFKFMLVIQVKVNLPAYKAGEIGTFRSTTCYDNVIFQQILIIYKIIYKIKFNISLIYAPDITSPHTWFPNPWLLCFTTV